MEQIEEASNQPSRFSTQGGTTGSGQLSSRLSRRSNSAHTPQKEDCEHVRRMSISYVFSQLGVIGTNLLFSNLGEELLTSMKGSNGMSPVPITRSTKDRPRNHFLLGTYGNSFITRSCRRRQPQEQLNRKIEPALLACNCKL